jgi:hypothetical protein
LPASWAGLNPPGQSKAVSIGREEPLLKHRGIDFDVEEKPPSWWHWNIYPKLEAGPKVVGNMKFQTRAAAIAACIVEIDSGPNPLDSSSMK